MRLLRSKKLRSDTDLIRIRSELQTRKRKNRETGPCLLGSVGDGGLQDAQGDVVGVRDSLEIASVKRALDDDAAGAVRALEKLERADEGDLRAQADEETEQLIRGTLSVTGDGLVHLLEVYAEIDGPLLPADHRRRAERCDGARCRLVILCHDLADGLVRQKDVALAHEPLCDLEPDRGRHHLVRAALLKGDHLGIARLCLQALERLGLRPPHMRLDARRPESSVHVPQEDDGRLGGLRACPADDSVAPLLELHEVAPAERTPGREVARADHELVGVATREERIRELPANGLYSRLCLGRVLGTAKGDEPSHHEHDGHDRPPRVRVTRSSQFPVFDHEEPSLSWMNSTWSLPI